MFASLSPAPRLHEDLWLSVSLEVRGRDSPGEACLGPGPSGDKEKEVDVGKSRLLCSFYRMFSKKTLPP